MEPNKISETVEIPAKFKTLVESVEKMSVLELNELVKLLEKKFGVSAQAVATAVVPAAGASATGEEKSTFAVHLASTGAQKIAVIKIIKEVLDEALGLGPLEDLLADESVTEIMVNGKDNIFVAQQDESLDLFLDTLQFYMALLSSFI